MSTTASYFDTHAKLDPEQATACPGVLRVVDRDESLWTLRCDGEGCSFETTVRVREREPVVRPPERADLW